VEDGYIDINDEAVKTGVDEVWDEVFRFKEKMKELDLENDLMFKTGKDSVQFRTDE
jgi:hypothetical protein